MDKSVLLQKTIRENNEDLHSYVRDLKNWESDMKRKDSQLSSKKENTQILPPIRKNQHSKKQRVTTQTTEKKTVNPKRISSYDYSSWDKFDVDKACEAVDSSQVEPEKEFSSESDSEQEILRTQQQALYEKELGNNYVKKGNWEKAIEQYTKAIQCYDKDAVFFANRALCYLKTNKLLAAETDCSKSLELDAQYVKAYQRRAAARIGLKKIKEAQSDLNNVLRLEPNNSEAKKDLENLKVNKSAREDNKFKKEKSSSEKSVSSISKVNIEAKSQIKESGSVNLKSDVDKQIYKWDPVDNKRVINAIYKPPHLRSKKPLKRINIIDVDTYTDLHPIAKSVRDFKNVTEEKQECDNSYEQLAEQEVVKFTSRERLQEVKKIHSAKDVLINDKKRNEISNATTKATNDCSSVLVDDSSNIDLPPPPRTCVQFNIAWRKLKGNSFSSYLYLKSINGKNFPLIFRDSMESALFSEVISTLATEFLKHKTSPLSYLEGLMNIRRFSMLVLFMSEGDQKDVKKLIDYCVSSEEITEDYALKLNKDFQLI